MGRSSRHAAARHTATPAAARRTTRDDGMCITGFRGDIVNRDGGKARYDLMQAGYEIIQLRIQPADPGGMRAQPSKQTRCRAVNSFPRRQAAERARQRRHCGTLATTLRNSPTPSCCGGPTLCVHQKKQVGLSVERPWAHEFASRNRAQAFLSATRSK